MNYLQHVLEDGFEEYQFLPLNFRTSKHFTFFAKGFGEIKLVCDDSQLNLILDIFSAIFKRVFQEYSDKYIFSSPEFIFRPLFEKFSETHFELKIAMLEKEKYNEILEKRNLDQDD